MKGDAFANGIWEDCVIGDSLCSSANALFEAGASKTVETELLFTNKHRNSCLSSEPSIVAKAKLTFEVNYS